MIEDETRACLGRRRSTAFIGESRTCHAARSSNLKPHDVHNILPINIRLVREKSKQAAGLYKDD